MMLRSSALRTLFLTLLALGLSVAPAAAQVGTAPIYPGESWEHVPRTELAAYGWSQDGLRRAFEFIRDSANTTGLVVVDRGRVVFDYGDIEELSYIASVRKSVLAMLYGEWVENGVIDLDRTLADLGMDDIGGLLPIEKQATVHHLITARSGVFHPASYSGDDLSQAPERGSQTPGTYMLYSNWDFNAAGHAFELITGRNIYDEVQAQLATPLRMEDWDRSIQQKAGDLTVSQYAAYPMWFSTRDMARIGYLMLREGAWEGDQLISKDWVRRITGSVTPLEEMNPERRRQGHFGYGYMWWIYDGPNAVGPFAGAYSANGAWGQYIVVLPALDVVIAHKTNNAYERRTSGAELQRMMELLLEAKGADGPFPWR